MTPTHARIFNLPIWDGDPAIAPLQGGLSNESYVVTDMAGRHVVRLGHDFPFHHVERDRELMTARAAFAAGFGAPVEHAEPGLTVVRYIEGRTYTPEDMRRNIDRIAEIVRRFHTTMGREVRGPGYIFWPFHVIRDYAETLKASPHPLVARVSALLEINGRLEAAQAPLPIVFGHHDFLPANIIDDGKRLWIIDYEYAGFGTAMFDLANISSNSGFSAVEGEQLLKGYFGADLTDALRRSHAAMQCASLLREAMWSLVSEMFMSVAGADYDAYARENFIRFDAALESYRSTYGGA